MEDAVDDSLHFINDKDISIIVGDDDQMLLSYKVIKINRYGLSQERNMIVTKKNIYNLKKKGK